MREFSRIEFRRLVSEWIPNTLYGGIISVLEFSESD